MLMHTLILRVLRRAVLRVGVVRAASGRRRASDTSQSQG